IRSRLTRRQRARRRSGAWSSRSPTQAASKRCPLQEAAGIIAPWHKERAHEDQRIQGARFMKRASNYWNVGTIAAGIGILTLAAVLAISPEAFAWGRRMFGGGFGGGGFGGEGLGGGGF